MRIIIDEKLLAEEREEPPVTEPVMIFDIFVTGVMKPEDHGETIRLVWYADRPLTTGGGFERVVVARLVMPRKSLIAVLWRLALWAQRKALRKRDGGSRKGAASQH